jgi:hypothetical protein
MTNLKNFDSKVEENVQIIEVLARNSDVLNKVSRFKDHFEKLNDFQKKLIDLNILINKDISSIEKDKNDLRNELLDKTLTVIRVMQVFANDRKKKNLQIKLEHLTSEYLQESSDMELVKISKKIWLVANKHGGYATTFINKIKLALNPAHHKVNIKFEKKYGLIPEMIKNIEDASIKFIESMLFWREEVKQKEVASREMKKLFKQTKKLLTNKIDRFSLLFETKNPLFYKEYRQLRDSQLPAIPVTLSDLLDEVEQLPAEQSESKPSEPKIRRKNTPTVNS